MISVMCPTRDRWEMLSYSLESLRANADDPSRLEFLLAIDPDDTIQAEFTQRTVIWVASERYGYGHLERYYNKLASIARGDWLMLWNDDATMLTKGWDMVVTEHEPACLFPHLDGPAQHCNGFPIWPTEWTRLLGHVSLGAYCDTWMQVVCQQVGVQQRVPIEISHHQPDDHTWREGRNVTPFAGPELDAGMALDAAKLRAYLEAP